jgi:hypothetical protein
VGDKLAAGRMLCWSGDADLCVPRRGNLLSTSPPARWRHIAGTAWSTKRCLNIELLKDQQMRGAITA